MKRFLRAGERYAFFLTTTVSFLLLIFCSVGTVFSQLSIAAPVGPRLPNEFWDQTFQIYDHDKVIHQTLEEFRGKPLILAFWSTTCSICIVRFPFFNQIVEENSDHLNILLVNSYERDSIPVIQTRFEKMDSTYRMPSVIQDAQLSRYFPHRGVPHYIWIDPKGNLIAKTGPLFMTKENITKFIKRYEKR